MKKILKWLFVVILPLVLYDIYFNIRSHYSQNLKSTSHYENTTYYWRYFPHASMNFKNEDGEEVIVKSDQFGFRNDDAITTPDILLLGDSFINAANTITDKTYAHVLKREGLKIYNAGMSGTGTCHQAYILKDILENIHPKIVIVHFYLGNDFHDNFFGPDLTSLKKRLEEKETIENAQENSGNSHDSYAFIDQLRDFKNIILTKSPSLKFLYERTLFLRPSYQSDMSAFDRAEMKTMIYSQQHPDPDIDKTVKQTHEAFRLMREIIAQYNAQHQTQIKLVVVGVPSKAQVLRSIREISNYEQDKQGQEFAQAHLQKIDFDQPDRLLAEICASQNIPYLSLLRDFRQSADIKLYYHFDAHWTWQGQQKAASLVLPWLKNFL